MVTQMARGGCQALEHRGAERLDAVWGFVACIQSSEEPSRRLRRFLRAMDLCLPCNATPSCNRPLPPAEEQKWAPFPTGKNTFEFRLSADIWRNEIVHTQRGSKETLSTTRPQ